MGPFAASLGQVRRRAILFLFAGALVVWGLITWANYTTYRAAQRAIENVRSGRAAPGDIFGAIGGGIQCDDGRQVCWLTDRTDSRIGPEFPQPDFSKVDEGKDPFQEAIRATLPQITSALRGQLSFLEKGLAPRKLLRDRANSMGTFFGILFVVFITATFIGAEWRWGVWRTLLTHEPRRGRVLAAKLAALWVAVAIGAALVLAFTAGLDVVFRRISDVTVNGGVRWTTIGRAFGRSLLSLELYATAAAALTFIVRSSFAGVGALAFLLADGLVTRRFVFLRHILPTQQISTLLPLSEFTEIPGYIWWPLIRTSGTRCVTRGTEVFCQPRSLPPIPHWRASAVIVGWIVALALLAWAFLRARDVPQ